MPAANKMKLGAAVAAVLAALVAMAIWAGQGDWKILYANLPDKEAGTIVAQLQQMNVPYKYSEGGGAIMVPADKLYDLKMRLAAAGLPKASVTGNELLDNARFGQTDRQERSTMQRALEGELARTILKLDGVEDVRVHLALPQQNGFFREQQKPSASVMLTLFAGRSLDRGQTAAIVHLVSSSVPDLDAKAVSVVDQHGNLLSGPGENSQQSLDEQQLRYVHQVEASYLKRVQDILEPVVGRDNLRVAVTTDVDFTQSEATSEQFRPNQGDQPAAVRSQQMTESSNPGNTVPTGVPGAATNQPRCRPRPHQRRLGPAAGGLRRHQRRQQQEGIGHQLRGRQDRAGDPQRHRHDQAGQRRGGGELPHRHRCQGQDQHQRPHPGRAGQADRPGAGGGGLRQEPRRLGARGGRPSRRRPSPPKRPCRCGSSPGCATCCAPPPCRAP
jgi:flagellar M-ring protein FliF